MLFDNRLDKKQQYSNNCRIRYGRGVYFTGFKQRKYPYLENIFLVKTKRGDYSKRQIVRLKGIVGSNNAEHNASVCTRYNSSSSIVCPLSAK